MLQIVERLNTSAVSDATLTLPFEQRQKSRQRVRLDDGREAALLLPRGTLLRGGDMLRAETGELIAVRAAAEEVSTARSDEVLLLTRAAYHLGNRHVPVQVGAAWLRYGRDHVLDEMLRRMGLDIVYESLAFEPEAGAYHHEH